MFNCLSLSGNNKIYIDGATEFSTVVTNNSIFNISENIIYTNNPVKIGNSMYNVGDTFFTQGNITNNVLIKSCTNIALSLDVVIFEIRQDKLYYDISKANYNRVELQASKDAKTWYSIDLITNTTGYIKPDKVFEFFRLKLDHEYSNLIKIKQKNKEFIIYDFVTGEVKNTEEGLYIKKYTDNSYEKIFKIK